MLYKIIFFCSFIVLAAAAGRAPHADYVEELVRTNTFGSRISDNILEDATLDLPDLVRKYNYPFEEHSVTTEDGYLLGLHRIPHGRDANNRPGNKQVVFLMHGMLSSSAENVIMGPGSGLAYILAEEGYDVWMGNARGTYFSRKHVRLNPDSILTSDFWKFSWDEIGNKDLPAMIDYALEHTGQSKLHYIGFSQGTTCFWVLTSLRPEYNDKIISMQALAPVAYMAHNKNPVFLSLAPFASQISILGNIIGLSELLPRSDFITALGKLFCEDGKPLQFLCNNMIFIIAGRNPEQLNSTMLPVITGHIPAGIALQQLAHYGQGIQRKEFRRYDYGLLRNLIEYRSFTPPRYDLSRITAPVFLHYAERDPLAHVNDVDRLFAELGNPIGKFRMAQRTFSHVDFVWGIDAKTMVFDRMINLMKRMEN